MSEVIEIMERIAHMKPIEGSFKRSKLKNGLTLRQMLFVEYFIRNGGHGKAAVIEAGYKTNTPKAYAHELLKKSTINEMIMKRIHEHLNSKGLTADSIINELIAIAFSNIKKLSNWSENSVSLKDSAKLHDFDTKAIQQLTQRSVAGGHKTITLKLYDKLKALELLAKYLGLFDHPLAQHTEAETELSEDELINALYAEIRRGLFHH